MDPHQLAEAREVVETFGQYLPPSERRQCKKLLRELDPAAAQQQTDETLSQLWLIMSPVFWDLRRRVEWDTRIAAEATLHAFFMRSEATSAGSDTPADTALPTSPDRFATLPEGLVDLVHLTLLMHILRFTQELHDGASEKTPSHIRLWVLAKLLGMTQPGSE